MNNNIAQLNNEIQTGQSIEIDWNYYLERRRALLVTESDLPAYLLQPEINEILDVTKNDIHHFLINTLWHTGGRISEVLSLTPKHFYFDGAHPEIVLPTLKQRGRPKANKPKQRILPVFDGDYIDEALRYFSTHKGKNKLLFDINRSTADRWLKAAVRRLIVNEKPLSIPVSCHTLRHSFAVNCILHCVDTAVLQAWLGHRDRAATEIYTKVLNQETSHLMTRVSFK